MRCFLYPALKIFFQALLFGTKSKNNDIFLQCIHSHFNNQEANIVFP